MTTENDVRPMCQHRNLRGACAEPRCACVAGHTSPHHDEFGRVIPPEQPCQAKDFSGETWCQREVVAGRDYCWSHLPFPPGKTTSDE